MADQTEVSTTTAQPAAEATESTVEKFVEAQYGEAAAAESAAEKPEESTEAKAAVATDEAKAEAEQKAVADEPFTTEQIADPKFWDRLDRAGWEKAAKLHPVETSRVKAGYAAASKIAAAAKQQKPDSAEERSDAKPALSPELQSAFRKMQSLDESEALEGFREMQRITLRESLPEFGLDPNRAHAERVATKAYEIALAALPELENLDNAALDAVVEADPILLALVATGNENNVALAMKRAGETLIAKQKADSDKAAAEKAAKDKEKAEKQAKLRANASVASSTVVESPSGGARQGEETPEQYVNRLYREAAAREGASA